MQLERKVNLEEILNKYLASRISLEVDYDDYVLVKRAMKEACRQVLELAAENVTMYEKAGTGLGRIVYKPSITNTINQVE